MTAWNMDLNVAEAMSIAAWRAAMRLGLSTTEMAHVLGVTEAATTEYRAGTRLIPRDAPECTNALRLISINYELATLLGSADVEGLQRWMRSFNRALGAVPADLIQEPDGLSKLLEYLGGARSGEFG